MLSSMFYSLFRKTYAPIEIELSFVSMTESTKRTVILSAFVLLKFVLQYNLISPEYELQRDEYLHIDQANHLAWGYLSVPPVTSWISFVIQLMGNSVFWIKFFPALFGALTMVVVWKAIHALQGSLFACMLGASGVLFSALLRLNTLYQPNSLDVLCWTAFYFTVIKFISTEKRQWLYTGAVVFAVGFLNKYNIAFLLMGLFPAVLITAHRRWLTHLHLYMAIIMALLIVLPNLWWQYRHGFPVFNHLQLLSERQLVHVDRWNFVRSQFLFFTGAWLMMAAALFALCFYRPFRNYRIFIWSLIFTLAIFIYFRAKDYYAIGIYPIYIAFGSVYLGELLNTGWKRYLKPGLLAIPVLFFIPLYGVVFPNKSPEYIVKHESRFKAWGLLRWEDGKDHALPQDFADMLGWKELAAKVDSLYILMPHPENTLILCDNYGQAGAINFYTQQNIRAVSFNADYIHWFDLKKKYLHLIRVKEYSERAMELQETSPYFQKSLMADSITNPYAREFGTTIFVFEDARIDITKRIKAEIAEVSNGHEPD